MRFNQFKSGLMKSGLAASVLLFAGGATFAQQTINLTAAPANAVLSDGSAVPMWGYTCGIVAANTAPVATCAAANPAAVATAATASAAAVMNGWSPVIITVPTGQTLTINLTNSLSFAPSGNTVPTSLTIVGQVGGGLGSQGASCVDPLTGVSHGASCTPSPVHAQQSVTWSTANMGPGGATTYAGAQNTPPAQAPRVQSFGTEVAAGTTTALTWNSLRPGTYLIESGTHPSIQGPMGLYGILVVTQAPTSTGTAPATIEAAAGCAYPNPAPATTCGVPYDAEVPIVLSEIDPIQNAMVSAAVNTAGFSETTVWSGQRDNCGNPTSTNYLTCYPPAVNYTPLYYLMNGVAFSRANAAASLFPAAPATLLAPATGTTRSVLVRLVNAGLRMHVPSIVGSQTTGWDGKGTTASATTPGPVTTVGGFQLIAEDGNHPKGIAKVQSDVFMAAGKTVDLMINAPAVCTAVAPATTCVNPALPIFDRELSLSANQINRDGGMLAYIGVNGGGVAGAGLPAAASMKTAVANPDAYAAALVGGIPLVVSDVSKGVIANDVNVYGVKVSVQPTKGTLTLNVNGTFTYLPNAGTTTDSFTYCANGSSTVCATVNLGGGTPEAASGITCTGNSYTANTSLYLAVKTPGVLAGCTDAAGYPLKLATGTITPSAGLTVNADVNGGFTATLGTPCAAATCSASFTYQVQNSQGTLSPSTSLATANLTFQQGSGIVVNVIDGATGLGLNNGVVTSINQGAPPAQQDYRWVIEEDLSFYVNPNCATNTTPLPPGCPSVASGGTLNGNNPIVPTFGVNFHTSHMPFVAQGCTGPLSCEMGQTAVNPATGNHDYVACDVSNGVCRYGNGTAISKTPVFPGQVYLDPTKRYYLSVLPGDAANPFMTNYQGAPDCTKLAPPNANGGPYGAGQGTAPACGHGMGGAPIGVDPNTLKQPSTVTVVTQPAPYPPSKLSVFVFEDDFPLNGEQDGGGGTADVLSNVEPGLGGFQLHLWDAMGGNGDFTGQMTYDFFNMPLTNSLDGTVDPVTGQNACPITQVGINNPGTNATNGPLGSSGTAATTAGITGMIVTCPKYETDGVTLSPLAGQAVISNLMPGRWGVIATPGADRISRGEEWLQTNTLDGQKAHDAFTRIGEPSYFQEFGPASFHVSIGFANPKIIQARHAAVCSGSDPTLPGTGNCKYSIKGRVVGEHLSRTPDERLYGTGSHDAFAWTQCYVSFGDPDGEDFAFTKCNADGTFEIDNLPPGSWRVTTFDQWNDALVDGLSTPVGLGTGQYSNCNGTGNNATTCDMGDIATTQWQTNLYTRTFIDDNRDGVSQSTENGIPFANVAVRLRDGSIENLLVTDFTGTANFNETFPLFSWYTVETDYLRYKNSGTHVVYDVGGPTDGSPSCGITGYPPCGNSTIGKFLANTAEIVSVPNGSNGTPNLRVPGAIYCAGADCSNKSMLLQTASDPPSACTTSTASPPITSCSTQLSSGRIDPPWVNVEGFQGFPGQNNFLEFGKEPYVAGENGGIKGHVVYASTRPFDDPQMLVQTQWEALIPHVTINLYQEGFAADGVTPTLTLVDTTTTSSFDDFAQGFRADGVTPNMNCPGQGSNTGAIPDLFYFSLYNQPNYLNYYASVHGGPALQPLPNNSQFKCYDGMHNWNQLQPVPYDGQYQFPSVATTDTTGKPLTSNCTICKPNPVPSPDRYAGVPMLPPGKYVVEVVVPPGFELVKEEDKNILIGDQFIAPVVQQFAGNTNIFIVPDQASVAASASGYGPNTAAGVGYNANNAQNPTQSFGATPSDSTVPGFTVEPVWPCVGTARIVPDYISLFPQSKQVAPFAGATRNLCDRKEVTLGDQMGAIAKFYLYTSTHVASKFTGGITDDYTSEFDPFSPQFGEKFAPPNLPVSVKDWAGNETNRVYADQWGAYNGMTYSTWEVNPPNPTGYSPTMMVLCMNDPGPILDTRTAASILAGSMITDPAYTQGYSQFCYELPFMPATTQYLDTPVVPTSAFAGAGYNNVDCAYPTLTPAISSVTSSDIAGPWAKAAGSTLTITALGDQTVPNNAYSGPSATAAPYNLKYITRHYGFGATQGTGSVTIGGVNAPVTKWSDASITVTVPTLSGNPNFTTTCPVQQQAVYAPGATPAYCGELVVKAGNGLQSIDAVTVTVGGKTPTVLTSTAPLTQYSTGAIQAAIDAAAPGDMIIVPPGTYNEMILMWKPVRLQGVGAASSIINANTQPAGKLDPWRREVNCLFGLALDGTPLRAGGTAGSAHGYDPTGTYACNPDGTANFAGSATTLKFYAPFALSDGSYSPQVDRLPLEAVVGWDATLNGNLAQLLQEATLMGALEGAGVTVLGKGVNFNSNPFASDTFPTGTTLLSGPGTSGCATTAGTGPTGATSPLASNFYCNPSSINGLSITGSSQGGGAVFLHGWNHNLEIANNRIKNNAGTLSGGINVGQGEFAPPFIAGGTNAAPGSCATVNSAGNGSYGGTTIVKGQVEPYCENVNVNVHNNYVSLNSSTGDELFSATPAGAGGVSFCTGADNYKFNYNWVCGNLSSGDGGGLGHLGLSYNGDIEHNTFLFNQSLNPTIPANGGAMIVMGSPDVDPACSTVDQDCVNPLIGPNGQPIPPSVGPSDGVGPNLVINANLIMGNGAEAGTGGGISFQNVNGTDVVAFPGSPQNWWHVKVTNNIIANNVAGWDGAGISLLDALNIDFVNNTIISNSTTASAGVLFTTLGAPLASQPGNTGTNPSSGKNCIQTNGTSSCPQVAGLVSEPNSSLLTANLVATGVPVVCPAGHYTSSAASNGNCVVASIPELYNNVIWQNSAYYVGVGPLSSQFQQTVISLYNAFTSTQALSEPPTPATTANGNGKIVTGGTGACVNRNFWDIGVRGDTGPGDHSSTVMLAPAYSTLTNPAENALGTNNELGIDPTVVQQYCNGSRQPPEFLSSGWAVPAGISDATVPNPIFSLTPVATVDEGNNWVNLRWGPLTTVSPASLANPLVLAAPLGNYAPAAGSPVINYITSGSAAYTAAPLSDFFGNPRKGPGNPPVDIGAVQHVVGTAEPAIAVVSPTSLAFGSVAVGTTSAAQTLTLRNDGGTLLTGINVAVTAPFFRAPVAQGGPGSCGTQLAVAVPPPATCTINVVFSPTATTASTGTATITSSVTVNGSPVTLTGTGAADIRTASVSPSPLAFGTWAAGTSSNALTLTVTNTGNIGLTGGTFVLGGATPQPFSRTGGTCNAALAVAATCTINVVFSPAVGTANLAAFSRTLTVAYTGATVTPAAVTLTGTSVTALASVSITPNPLTITTATSIGTGTVVFKNTAPARGAQILISNVNVAGGSFFSYFFTGLGRPNTCTGAVLAPGQTCTAGALFVNVLSPRGTDRAGTITFTDNGASPTAPSTAGLVGTTGLVETPGHGGTSRHVGGLIGYAKK
ncbi:MAG: choice-of-anchor D domain-containing protein [Steroidobacteraceae bacterium]